MNVISRTHDATEVVIGKESDKIGKQYGKPEPWKLTTRNSNIFRSLLAMMETSQTISPGCSILIKLGWCSAGFVVSDMIPFQMATRC
ncbi:MAG: hypothetical protein E5Y38_28775 [Mesorhizobium sp.]|uniref:hypothetical protein n=1 Tax=Mesorhizobium sp. TaxID=1871066 RepID=UPI0012009884|nr:hypothetical protein [Mesorhizobium sp.]TIM94057.1 MAG: hypothetical protein E5Y38_28775 [Mesorhizobium sp.]